MPIKFHPVVSNPEWEREDSLISSDSTSTEALSLEELKTPRNDRAQRSQTLRTEKVTATAGKVLASSALCLSNTRIQETALITRVLSRKWGEEGYHAFKNKATCANCCHKHGPLARHLLHSSPHSNVFHFFNINTIRFIAFQQYFQDGD